MLAGAFALTAACSGTFERLDAGDAASQDAQADGFPRFDVASDGPVDPFDCVGTGSGQIRVGVEIPQGVDLGGAPVWLGAMCVDARGFEHPVRVAWASSGSRSTTLSGLPPGNYVVRATTLVVPSVRSPLVTVRDGSTIVTQLTLVPGPQPLRVLRTMLAPSGDAGLGPDSGVGTLSGSILRPGSRDQVGTVEASIIPRDGTSIDVEVHLRNEPCTANCVTIRAIEADLRVSDGTQPLGFAVTSFLGPPDVVAIQPGSTVSTPVVTLPGSPQGRPLELSVAVFGVIEALR